MNRFLLFIICIATLGACSDSGLRDSGTNVVDIPAVIDYNLHIKPILSDRCFACHGPDKASQKAGLALHTAERAYAELAETPGHFAIVKGNTAESEVVKRITSDDPELLMPPAESNLTLSDHERELITRWIEQGAEYKPHWSFIPVKKPEIPTLPDESWIENPIDNFTLSKMRANGLSPEKKASKEKLIRRVSFDLTGLPPTLEEIDRFVNDESDEAYEKVVDRLLNSVAYAERMTARWLDIARYADSHGYQDDFYRSMWPWREWVIEAYNKNLPFDQFLSWQMAGDLLPNATYEQKLATGFNRNHSINQEVGIIDEEFRVEYVADRTNTLGTSVLGLTLECARCHDHKYDPISQKEYFQLYSFFNSVPEKNLPRGHATGPSVEYPEEKLNELRDYLNSIDKEQSTIVDEKLAHIHSRLTDEPKFKQWLKHYKQTDATTASLASTPKAYFSFQDLNRTNTNGIEPKQGKYGKGLFNKSGQPYSLGRHPYITHNKPFSVSFWFYNFYKTRKYLISKISEPKGNGINIEYLDGYIKIFTPKSHKDHGLRMSSAKMLPDQQWVHVAVTYDGSGITEGFSLYIDGKPMPLVGNAETPLQPIDPLTPLAAGYHTHPKGQHGLGGSGVDEIYFFDYEISDKEIGSLNRANPIQELVAKGFNTLSAENKALLADHYLYHHDREFKIALRNLDAVAFKKLDIPDKGTVRAMTMADMDEPEPTFILKRGAYDAHGERVYPGTPESVLTFADSLPKNRLGLAQWLTDPQNPLTARVAINRYWSYIFGKGIVSTVDDFGNQGALPSHPELLDWLAATFVESGWNIKAMLKLMVMSATYQQQSATSAEKRALDPDNTYLARGVRQRMPIEMIRDQALAASGLLNPTVGGPGVRPYQPDNLWGATTGGGGGPLAKFVLDISPDLYRRSLYTFWKRTVPPPAMLTFDAATRDRCVVSRQSTNTPLQALVLLNDPQYMEAARVLAQTLLGKEMPLDENITTAFRKFTGRAPQSAELDMLREVHEQALLSFNNNPELSNKLLQVGDYKLDETLNPKELAALTLTISTILNLDETISKE